MSVFRAARSVSRPLRPAPAHARSFYSTFAALSDKTPLTHSRTTIMSTASTPASEYESARGKVYVVSETYPAERPYGVPAGAYPTSVPYASTDAKPTAQRS
ncbi:hypothetical protein OF83DRAFT_1168180 [Amylostereum chailletii]|nr:hypothetical protein OF83DRAFT_1168180 [Amylostereum chailletii]